MEVRGLMHADDIQSPYLSTIQNIHVAKGQTFNIGRGLQNRLSLNEYFKILEKLLEDVTNIKKIAPKLSDPKVFITDIKR